MEIEVTGPNRRTISELSKEFGKSKKTIRRWMKEQGLDHTKCGNELITDVAAIQRWANRNNTKQQND